MLLIGGCCLSGDSVQISVPEVLDCGYCLGLFPPFQCLQDLEEAPSGTHSWSLWIWHHFSVILCRSWSRSQPWNHRGGAGTVLWAPRVESFLVTKGKLFTFVWLDRVHPFRGSQFPGLCEEGCPSSEGLLLVNVLYSNSKRWTASQGKPGSSHL